MTIAKHRAKNERILVSFREPAYFSSRALATIGVLTCLWKRRQKMEEEDWGESASGPPSQPAAGKLLRGFGRGGGLLELNRQQHASGHTNGMVQNGLRNSGFGGRSGFGVSQDKDWDSGAAAPAGKARGGFGFSAGNSSRAAEGENGLQGGGGFGNRVGGFGANRVGVFEAKDDRNNAAPANKPRGGFGGNETAAVDEDWCDDASPPSRPRGGFRPSGGSETPTVQSASDGWDDSSFPAASSKSSFGGGRDRNNNRGDGCYRCGETGHIGRDCPLGGGSRGGGAGRGCHKCGEEGHFARECPSGGGGGNRACHKCGEESHIARDCPGGGSGRGRNSSCHKCGEEGHFARECPTGGGKKRGCHKCGDEGHFARECPNAYDGGGWGSKRGGVGFGSKDSDDNGDSFGGGGNRNGFGFGCKDGFGSGKRSAFGDKGDDAEGEGSEQPKRGFGGGINGNENGTSNGHDSGCRRCGEEGHFARDCPNKGGGGGKGGGACHRCGEEGHFVRECPKAAAEGEKPRELYIPPDIDEENMYKNNIHQGINFDKYDNIEVEVTGNKPTKPISSFEEAGLLRTFLNNVKKSGYTKPTPIQKYAIPAILAGRDLMGCAQTGSGKTAAFLLPVLTAMVNRGLTTSYLSELKEPQTIIVAPTRELAHQIFSEAWKFSRGTDVNPVVVYGGTDRRYQKSCLMKGPNLVVGTPGRLLDFIGDQTISLAKCQYLILDEADRMLDLGFEPDIRKLVDTLGMPPKTQRQTLMFSATFKPDIQKLASDFLNDYLFITVGIVGGACSDVTQTFLEVDRLQKREHLCQILNESGRKKVLVFVGQKRNADFLASFLSQSGYPTTSIHGDRLQREREEALRGFKRGDSSVLIATNVAARGLDIPEVAHVVNYDLPTDIDEYVHRIGRTGRCGNLGKATSFYNHDMDFSIVGHLLRILAEAKQEVPDWLAEYAGVSGGAGDRGTGRFASKDIRRRGKFATEGGNSPSTFANNSNFVGGDGGGVDNTCDDESWD